MLRMKPAFTEPLLCPGTSLAGINSLDSWGNQETATIILHISQMETLKLARWQKTHIPCSQRNCVNMQGLLRSSKWSPRLHSGPHSHSPLGTQSNPFTNTGRIISGLYWKLSRSFPSHLVLNVKSLAWLPRRNMIFPIHAIADYTPPTLTFPCLSNPGAHPSLWASAATVPSAWNTLPTDVRGLTTSVSLCQLCDVQICSHKSVTFAWLTDHRGFDLITYKYATAVTF